MAVLKLIGAKRYMNNRVSTHVIELNGVTPNIEDDALVASLLSQTRVDALNNVHPLFEVVDGATKDDEPVQEKKPAPRKKTSRSRAKKDS